MGALQKTLQRAKLPADLMDRPDDFAPAHILLHFMAESAAYLDSPHLGFRATGRAHPAHPAQLGQWARLIHDKDSIFSDAITETTSPSGGKRSQRASEAHGRIESRNGGWEGFAESCSITDSPLTSGICENYSPGGRVTDEVTVTVPEPGATLGMLAAVAGPGVVGRRRRRP